ncbi:MAG: heavy metal translocating P-type ATPase, partial [Erysipelotrichaceae bacterium]|nr:heavy metal translocating P-type ATPase [Erysipelotrichaceae bacterium]
NFFEARVKEKTASSLEAIMNLGVKEARVLVDGTETMLPLDQVKVGDIVVVLPQEKVPLDGRINDGASYLDEAMLNGESMPRFKTKDDVVLGATLNLTGRLIVTVTAVGAETVLAQIIKTVEDVALYKPKSQRIADKIASIFVPIIVVIAVLTFILQLSITKDSETAFKTAIAVLVVSCPCALGLATPTSIAVASGLAYRQGFLYKGGEFFEKAHRITAIAFDKTGTLTIGHPKVVNFVGDPASYRFTKSLEAHSNHPLASAIKAYQNDEILVVQDFEIIAGTGIKGQIMGNEVTIGSKRILDELQLTNPYPLEYDTDSKAGKTVIFTIINQKVVNMISLIDPLKDDAKALIKSLVARNIKPIMITGDQKDTAAYLALDLGIETVYAETLPHQKAKLIEEIRSTGNVVAFVGDGINDAPALKMADVGFVVSTGTDIALDSADVVLMKPDLNLVLQAIDLSKATLRSIYLNFFWAFVYNISLVPVAALGYLDPRLAGIGMGFSSIMVVLNALSLNLFNLRKKGEK